MGFGLTGHYYECTSCRFLHTSHLDDPGTLERVYSRPDTDCDPAAAWRQFCVAKRMRQLALWRAFGWRYSPLNALDVGAGSGFLPAFLAHDLGWNAIGYEPYERPAYSPRLHAGTWEAVSAKAPFQVVTASEVLEHLREPLPELRRIASVMDERRSFLYVTTGAYDPDACDQHWPYLATHTAQHCSFYSREALARVGEVIGASLVLQVGREAEWLFVRGSLGPIERVRLFGTAALVRATTPRRNRVG
ncbi:MAG TPA: class I SAM-dependent methyltransferase [Candidatus Limnocylindria bacterium]|nr:class I SAM-dependent methyltransferase [Candidatus Limnocylindria bacterium]